jgi:hypothetical protein
MKALKTLGFILFLFFSACTGASEKREPSSQNNKIKKDSINTSIDSLIIRDLKSCDCSNSMKKTQISLNNSYPLIICSYEKLDLDTAVLISGFYIGSCSTKSTIVDQQLDEINQYWLHVKPDSIIISSTHPVLVGDTWDYKLIPLEKRSITLENEKLKTNNQFIFTPPELTPIQKDSILSFITYLEKKKNSNPKKIFPGDETAVIILFMGVIHDIGNSRTLWKKLREDFILDGAIAETYGEMYYDLITTNYKH